MFSHSCSVSGHFLDHLSRARIARVGVTKVKVPPWIMGNLQPIVDCRSVTIPDTKKIVEMM